MQLSPRRLFFGTWIALGLAALAVSPVVKRASVSVSARNQAAAATARLDAALPGATEESRAIALAYLERARLGLGSPFRLIEQAVRDPRLAADIRYDVAWAIVGRLFNGDVYEIDPRALDLVSRPGAGGGHLALIEETIREVDDPIVGEATVRLAYALASSNGSTSLTSVPVVAEAAAQVRDRVLARRDLQRAIAGAERAGVNVVDHIVGLRAARALAVEAPRLTPLSFAGRESAIDAAPSLLARIETVTPAPAETSPPGSLLDRNAALALARIAPGLPPLAAVRVPVIGRAATLRADSGLARSALSVISAAANEESLVAAFAYADQASDGQSGALRRLMVSAGVSLRAHAQDQVWFPGQPGLTTASVVSRFRLKGIAFDRTIPRSWRPFYTQMIASAIDDFQRVIPGYDPAGLSFRVEMGALPDSALAMHDPRTHTIRLSAMTPSGTLAHELAHDVDWRAARRLFTKSGGYATDRSIRENGARLASSVRGLTSVRAPGGGRISPHGSARPAEVFARSMDWYVADALASMGRSNGYLSAIEDPLLAGFASTPADAPSLEASRALVGTLTGMTWVPDSATARFVDRWSSLDALEPSIIVTRAMDASVYSRRMGRPPLGLSRSLLTELRMGVLCRVDAMREGTPQERLVSMAIDARARGIAVRRARYAPSSMRAAEDIRQTTAAVAEGFARAGLLDMAPVPFRPMCE